MRVNLVAPDHVLASRKLIQRALSDPLVQKIVQGPDETADYVRGLTLTTQQATAMLKKLAVVCAFLLKIATRE